MPNGYPKIKAKQLQQRRNKKGEMRWFGPDLWPQLF